MTGDMTSVDQDIRIRPARPDDLDQLRALDLAVFGGLAYPYFVLRQMFDVYRECWLVADHPDGLAGYSLGVPTLDRTLAWLLALAVAPGHRNLGYGRRLTLGSLALLRRMDVPEVRLTVQPGNEPAIALYRGIGFAVTGLHRNYLGPGEDRVIMAHPFVGAPAAGSRRCMTASDLIPVPRPISGTR